MAHQPTAPPPRAKIAADKPPRAIPPKPRPPTATTPTATPPMAINPVGRPPIAITAFGRAPTATTGIPAIRIWDWNSRVRFKFTEDHGRVSGKRPSMRRKYKPQNQRNHGFGSEGMLGLGTLSCNAFIQEHPGPASGRVSIGHLLGKIMLLLAPAGGVRIRNVKRVRPRAGRACLP